MTRPFVTPKIKPISRRTLLRGAGGLTLGLPLLDIMERPKRALAQEMPGYTKEGDPKRFIVFFSPNGTIRENWTPEGGETDWTFSRILKPLESFRDKLLIIDGVDQTGSGGDGHQNGMQGMLTGQTLNPGPFEGGDGASAGWANGISVDQRIADGIGGDSPLRSIELGILCGKDENNWNRMSLKGPDQPVPPEQSPYKAYERIFGGFSNSPDEDKLRKERERVVLGAVMENIKQLNAKLGREDRAKLEQHLEQVSEIEARLGKTRKAALDACATPVLGGEEAVDKNDNFPLVGRLQMDLLAMAMTCGLTQVGSIMWNRSVGGARHIWVDPNMTRGHHDFSHDGDTTPETIESLTQINVWYAQQFAYLLTLLDSVTEGSGTMLDNTVVFWCNELERGNSHSRKNSHYVVAGGAGYFKMGRCLKYDYAQTINHNNLLLSLVHSMGLEDDSFGNPEWCTGPLDGMLG